MEIADSGVKVLLICPGPVMTDLFSNALHSHIEIVSYLLVVIDIVLDMFLE